MFHHLLIYSLFIGALHAIPGSKKVSQRIFDGQDTLIESVPCFVTVGDEDQLSCGGAIISSNWILTTAQCVAKANNNFRVRAGTNSKEQMGSVHRVEKVIKHEGFAFNDHWLPVHNIALVRVKEPFEMDATRKAIQLFESHETVRPGTLGKVSGFGISRGPELEPKTLQSVEVPVIAPSHCEASLAKYGGVPDVHICASEDDEDLEEGGYNACFGDQGGPLVVSGRLAGLVSHVFGCATKPHLPVIYTDIGHYQNWVKRQLLANGEPLDQPSTPAPAQVQVVDGVPETPAGSSWAGIQAGDGSAPAPAPEVPEMPQEAPQDAAPPAEGQEAVPSEAAEAAEPATNDAAPPAEEGA